MSAIADVQTEAAPFDDETPTTQVRYSFKLTEENKERVAKVSLNEDVEHFVKETSIRSARWRSFGQFMNDALLHYLNNNSQEKSAREIVEDSTWDSEHQNGFAITESLFSEIDLLVNQIHTPWTTKQEFYTCALFTFIDDDLPVVEIR